MPSTRKMTLSERIKRNRDIFSAVSLGFSYAQVGKALGISRQAVGVIVLRELSRACRNAITIGRFKTPLEYRNWWEARRNAARLKEGRK